ncbi:MAG TPA: hypothetical protein VNU96_20515 [Burkholderiales bacterium]|jgi:hypothetical protein|nr:hypothetical protein [Burkholderiales bacterium]
MSVGNRVYIIEGDSITPVAQKTFDEFFFSERPALRAYSGRTLTFAMPTYELENKRPSRVVRFDTLRLAVKQDGSLDQDHYRRCLAAIFAAIDAEDPAAAATARKPEASLRLRALTPIFA